MTNLSGKTILITGASKGIGKAIALSLASGGANLGLVARSKNELQQLQTEIISKEIGRASCRERVLVQV